MAVRFTSGTKKMLDAYGIIADAIGLKDVAAKLRAESQALKAGSSLADTRKAISRSEKIATEVRERSAKIKNIIIGTLDFSAAGKDAVTGQVKVLASLSGKVYAFDEDGELEIVAALKPISRSGMAASEEDARKSGVDLLSEEAIDEIITKLNNKRKND